MHVESEPQGATGASLLVFLLGVAVGATAAVMYAPASGAETRAQLADKAEKLKGKAGEITERAVEWKDKVTSAVKSGQPHAVASEVASV